MLAKRIYHLLMLPLLGVSLLLMLLGGGCMLRQAAPPRVWAQAPSGKAVEVIQLEDGSFQLLRNDEPFFIKGVGGRDHLALAAELGANTIRTWSTAGLDTLLDQADSLGMVVMAGLDVVPGRLGLDYRDTAQVGQQLNRLRKDILRYKDHPALLMWIVGNEPDLMYDEMSLWKGVDDIAAMIKTIDPEHPTTIAMQGRSLSVEKLAL
ncbi:MAG: glycoside hydrolase family 2 TIM barrel-domain containing protein, partial [Bacteroidota bacterium]